MQEKYSATPWAGVASRNLSQALAKARSVAEDDRQPPKVRTRARLLEAHAAQLADGMVYVPGGAAVLSGETVTFDAFYIDRFEVTNSQFKLFVLAGGY